MLNDNDIENLEQNLDTFINFIELLSLGEIKVRKYETMILSGAVSVIDGRILEKAIHQNNIDFIKEFFKEFSNRPYTIIMYRCENIMEEAVTEAINRQDVEILKILHEYNLPFNDNLMNVAVGYRKIHPDFTSLTTVTEIMKLLYKWNIPINEEAMIIASQAGKNDSSRIEIMKLLHEWNAPLNILKLVSIENQLYLHDDVKNYIRELITEFYSQKGDKNE